MNIQERDNDTIRIGEMADRKVYGFVEAEVFGDFLTRLKHEGVVDSDGRADIGKAVSMLVTEYAHGANIHRPAARKVSTGADYLGGKA